MKKQIQNYSKPILFILGLFPIIIINNNINNYNVFFQISNFIIVIWSLYKLFPLFSSSQFNTNAILYLFIYLFIGIAPLYQYSKEISLWGGVPLKPSDYCYTNCIFIIAILTYQLFYNIFYTKKAKFTNKNINKERKYQYRKFLPFIIALVSFFITIYAFRTYPFLLFFREMNDGEKIIFDTFGNTTLNLIYTIIIRPLPIFILIFYNFIFKKKDIIFFLLIIIALVTNFPLSLPRFYVAALYLPLFFSFYTKSIKNDILMKSCLILAVLYLFPFLNQGRTATSIEEISFNLGDSYEMFLEGHFDSYQNFARVITNNTVTFGQQLWGVLCFWVPRSIYINKPIGSGGYIANLYGLDFDHISLNYWGEGWINFGIIGVILFSLILAYIHASFDYKYWNLKSSYLFKIIYFTYLGLIFFILRGDLISCFAYTVGLFTSIYLCFKSFIKNETNI